MNYETNLALCNAHEISSSDAYFAPRPLADSREGRKLFSDGFERGWNARAKQHSGEAVGIAFVQNGQIGFSIHNPNVKIKDGDLIYLSPQQPESVADALEKAAKICDGYAKGYDSQIEGADYDDFIRFEFAKDSAIVMREAIRNLINQPTQKEVSFKDKLQCIYDEMHEYKDIARTASSIYNLLQDVKHD